MKSEDYMSAKAKLLQAIEQWESNTRPHAGWGGKRHAAVLALEAAAEIAAGEVDAIDAAFAIRSFAKELSHAER